MNQQLLDYISDQLQAGLSYHDIETALLGVGWDQVEVKRALASFAGQQASAGSVSSEPVASLAQPAQSMPDVEPVTATSQATQSQAPAETTNQMPDTSALASVVGEAAANKSVPSTDSAPATAQVSQEPTQSSVSSQTITEPVSTQQPSQLQPTPTVTAQPEPTQPPQAAGNPADQPNYAPPVSSSQTMAQPIDPYAQATAPVGMANQPPQAQSAYPQASAQPYQSPAMQPYATSGAVPGYYAQPTPGYGQPAAKASGGIAGLFNKKIVIAIVAGVVFLVLLLIVALVLSGNKKTANNSNNNAGSQTNTNSLLEPQAFTSERGGFSINPPKGWHAQELTSTTDVAVAISKDTSDKSQFSSMTVTVSTIADAQAATTNLDSFVNFYKTATAQSNPQAKVNSDQKISLDGLDARLLDVDTVNDSTKVTGYMVYIIKDKKLYQIQAFTYDVTPNSEVKRAMRESIDSFKLTGAESSPTVSPSSSPKP